jgi:hypothetical protein
MAAERVSQEVTVTDTDVERIVEVHIHPGLAPKRTVMLVQRLEATGWGRVEFILPPGGRFELSVWLFVATAMKRAAHEWILWFDDAPETLHRIASP